MKGVGAYLIASYLYYECDFSVMNDTEFDMLCKNLLDNFDKIKHPHKHLLDRDALAAGTGHHITPGQYPTIVRTIAHCILEYDRQGRDYLKEITDATTGTELRTNLPTARGNCHSAEGADRTHQGLDGSCKDQCTGCQKSRIEKERYS